MAKKGRYFEGGAWPEYVGAFGGALENGLEAQRIAERLPKVNSMTMKPVISSATTSPRGS